MKYFTLKELCKSEIARRKGIDNTPGATEEANLIALVNNILDPLRNALGKPIIVTSGYRCPKLNKAVGGAASSQHMKGQAADIEAHTRKREDNKKLFELIRSLNLPFDQLINEFDYDWIHVSFGPLNRRKVLAATKKNGKTIYTTIS